MNILITGACGFIGSLLSEYLLSHGYAVTGIDSCFYNNQHSVLHLLGNERFTFYRRNVNNIDEIKKEVREADVLILLHALVGMPICLKYPDLAWRTNAESIGQIVDLLSKDQKIIYLNSNSGYGTTDGLTPCTEQSVLRPISVYGQSKCQGEDYVLNHANSISLRLATVFGVSARPRFDLLVNNLFAKLYFDKTITLYETSAMRNYVHIRDVVRAISWSIANVKGIFNVGQDKINMSKIELATKICLYLNLEPSQTIIEGVGSDPDKRNYIVSSQKIINRGFQFTYLLEDGFRELDTLCRSYNDKDKVLSMGNV